VEKESLGSVNLKNADTATFLQNIAKSSPNGRKTPKNKTSSNERSGDDSLATSPNLKNSQYQHQTARLRNNYLQSKNRRVSLHRQTGAQSLPSLSDDTGDIRRANN
jgi:hypothetical protein